MTAALVGSNPTSPVGQLKTANYMYGPLAQVVEHLTFNQVVRGSSPRWLIIMKRISRKWYPFLINEIYDARLFKAKEVKGMRKRGL